MSVVVWFMLWQCSFAIVCEKRFLNIFKKYFSDDMAMAMSVRRRLGKTFFFLLADCTCKKISKCSEILPWGFKLHIFDKCVEY